MTFLLLVNYVTLKVWQCPGVHFILWNKDVLINKFSASVYNEGVWKISKAGNTFTEVSLTSF